MREWPPEEHLDEQVVRLAPSVDFDYLNRFATSPTSAPLLQSTGHFEGPLGKPATVSMATSH